MNPRGLARPMTRTAGRALVALLLLVPLVAPLGAAAPTTFTVNVVSARSLGCSPDFFTSPDLRVRVLVNDVPLLTTPEASDQREPVFAFAAVASAQLPATIAVEVEEGEPSGFFGTQTTYVPCAVGPGGATRATFTYNGESVLGRTLRGEGDKAAEVVLVAGTNPPATPVPTATATTTSVTLQWAADATGQATGHRLARGGAGAPLQASVTATTATLSGLCDNEEQVLRVIRDTATWHVSSQDVRVKTANAAPWPPAVLSAQRAGNVSFQSRTLHDVERYEVHASSAASFTPSSATLRKTVPPPMVAFSARTDATGVPFQAGDQFVVVRVVDTGGLAADSAGFALGAPARQEDAGLRDDCTPPPAGGSGAPAEQPPSGEPAPPTSPTPQPPARPADPPCCFGVEMSAGADARVVAGGKLDVTFRSTSDLAQTLDVRLTDPSKGGAEQDRTILANVTLAPGQARTVAIAVPAAPRTPQGSYNLHLAATVRESGDAQATFTMPFVLEVPLQAWELEEENLYAVFEAKGSGTVLNATPGSVVDVQVTLINRAGHPLRVVAGAPAPALRNDSDIGRVVIAEGYSATISVTELDLAAYSKSQQTLTVRLPLDALVGDAVGAQVLLHVSNGVREADVPVFVNVNVVAGPPNVAATAAARGESAGGASGRAQVALLVGAGAAVGVAGAAAWLLSRDATRFAVAAALYTRLGRSEVLDHPGRDALHRRIQQEPGVTYSQLQRASGMNTGALVHHLRALERAGVVSSRKEGAYRRFYAAGAAPAASVLHVPALTPMQARVLEVLREAPLTQGELAERLGLSQQTTSHHVKSLVRGGHVEGYFDGRVWRYRPLVGFEVAP